MWAALLAAYNKVFQSSNQFLIINNNTDDNIYNTPIYLFQGIVGGRGGTHSTLYFYHFKARSTCQDTTKSKAVSTWPNLLFVFTASEYSSTGWESNMACWAKLILTPTYQTVKYRLWINFGWVRQILSHIYSNLFISNYVKTH